MTEQLHFHFSLSCIGEGNGNPLQYSCLENPRDEGAWWAAVYGVAQGGTRLKWLSSSSSIEIQNIYLLVRKTEVYIQICNWIKYITDLLLQILLLLLTYWCRSPTSVLCFVLFCFAQMSLVPRQGSVQKHCCCCLVTKSCLTLYDLMDSIACQAALFMGLPRQEYWNGLPFPFPGDLTRPRD